ncbi:MAG: hypothetical protein HYX40_04270 [Sphingobacteriales bacterium]|nr:hypothetical protein [Sphingobacteriales bacterium]
MISCSSSKIVSTWKTKEALPVTYAKILVVGLMAETERAMKEKLEDHMVGDLATLGYTAVSSYKEYGSKAFENMKEQEVLDKLKNSGIDAVLTIMLLDKTKDRIVYRRTPRQLYYNRFWPYYNYRYNRIYGEPMYYSEIRTKYFWESNFFEMNNKTLLYSVQTESFDPETANTLGHEYGKLIIESMKKNGVLIAKQ